MEEGVTLNSAKTSEWPTRSKRLTRVTVTRGPKCDFFISYHISQCFAPGKFDFEYSFEYAHGSNFFFFFSPVWNVACQRPRSRAEKRSRRPSRPRRSRRRVSWSDYGRWATTRPSWPPGSDRSSWRKGTWPNSELPRPQPDPSPTRPTLLAAQWRGALLEACHGRQQCDGKSPGTNSGSASSLLLSVPLFLFSLFLQAVAVTWNYGSICSKYPPSLFSSSGCVTVARTWTHSAKAYRSTKQLSDSRQ